MDINKKKKIAAGLSIISNITLSILKIIVGFVSGSLSILSEAIHSMSDLLASFVTFFSVVKSSEPADYDHPYGHGKYEDLAGLIEGVLIILASFYIIFEAVKKIISGVNSTPENTLGIAVMLVAVIMNIIVSSVLFKTAKNSNSISLYADGEHLRTDVYSSAGVLFGLVLIKVTGHVILDPVIAMLVAAFIYRTGYNLTKKSLMHLLDYSLSDDETKKIEEIINEFRDIAVLKNNSIKARQVGPSKDIDLILQFPENTTLCECHKICDRIEKGIEEIFENSSISIHPEPLCYHKNCTKNCDENCNGNCH